MSHSEVDIEKLLHDLQSKEAFRRKEAAEKLGELTTSNEQIASALMAVWESDSNRYVRQAANEALLAPAHLAILQQRPDWAEKMTKITPLQQPEAQAGVDKKIEEQAQIKLPRHTQIMKCEQCGTNTDAGDLYKFYYGTAADITTRDVGHERVTTTTYNLKESEDIFVCNPCVFEEWMKDNQLATIIVTLIISGLFFS